MKIFFPLLIICTLFLISCQKEISWGGIPLGPGGNTDSTDTTNGSNSGTLLIKSVSIQNTDTFTTAYTYDAAKRVETINITGTSGGIDAGNYRRFYRDAIGRITRIAYKVPPQSGIEIDTAFTYVYYPDATTFNYAYTVQKLSVGGFEVDDSTIYTYNSNNQITEGYDYQVSPLFGPVQESKYDYTFDAAGNLATISGYNNSSGTMDLVSTFEMQYDNKTNALTYDKQEFLISGGNPGSSHNNVTVLKFKDVSNSIDQVFNITYTYGSNGLPLTAVQQDLGTNSTTNISFYYQ